MNFISDTIKSSQSTSVQEELKEKKGLLRAVVNSMGEGLLVVTRDYNIRLMNPSAEEILGVKAKEVVGKPWTEVVEAYIEEKIIPFNSRTSIVVMNTG